MRGSVRKARAAPSDDMVVAELEDLARPIDGPAHLDPLIEAIGDAKYVLLGEATHGTSEFYTWRTEITRQLIKEKHFSFVAVEASPLRPPFGASPLSSSIKANTSSPWCNSTFSLA